MFALVLLAVACTSKAPSPRQVTAATPFAPQGFAPGIARADFDADAARPRPSATVNPRFAPTTEATPAPARMPGSFVSRRPLKTIGPCPDPQLVLSTIMQERPGGVAWTLLVTGECSLTRLELNVRLATADDWDAQCFVQETNLREKVADSEWSDMACSQVGYRPNNDLIEGWYFEPFRLAPGTSESRLTIVHRNNPATPPGLPAPVGLLFTWSWDGGEKTAMTWDALPIIGRSVEPAGETITRGLPVPGT